MKVEIASKIMETSREITENPRSHHFTLLLPAKIKSLARAIESVWKYYSMKSLEDSGMDIPESELFKLLMFNILLFKTIKLTPFKDVLESVKNELKSPKNRNY